MFARFQIIKLHDLGPGLLEIDMSREIFGKKPEEEQLPNDSLAVDTNIQCRSSLRIASREETKEDRVDLTFFLPKTEIACGLRIGTSTTPTEKALKPSLITRPEEKSASDNRCPASVWTAA